jgi:hypothetical protein
MACSPLELILKSLILQTIGRNPWMGDQPVAILLRTQENTNTE